MKSSPAKKSLKSVLFDLTVLASLVAAACLVGRGFGMTRAGPEPPGSAAIGRDYLATESTPSTLLQSRRQLQELQQLKSDPPTLLRSRRQLQELQQLKSDVTEEKTRLRDARLARGEAEEELLESQADDVLLQIELSERVLELDHLSRPLSAGMRALAASVRDAKPPEQLALETRFLHDHAARLDVFRGKVAAFHELGARAVGGADDLGEGYREKRAGFERVNTVFEELRSTFEELQTTLRSVDSVDEF